MDTFISIAVIWGNPSKALAKLKALDYYFPETGHGWWHKPPDNVRSLVAKTLSCAGCSGTLTLDGVKTAFTAQQTTR